MLMHCNCIIACDITCTHTLQKYNTNTNTLILTVALLVAGWKRLLAGTDSEEEDTINGS